MTEKIQPVFILPEGSSRSSGKTAQKANIAAAHAVSNIIKTTLGPKGMDKMIVNSTDDIVITNDGVTILNEMNIDNPAAKMIVEVAKVQEAEVGDGTTTAVVLAGELLHNAEDLIDKNIHPTVIADGYKLAAEKSHEILKSLGKKIDVNNKEILRNIAITAMTGKKSATALSHLADLTVNAVTNIIDGKDVDTNNIKIEKKEGGGASDTSLIQGIIIDKNRSHSDMPKKVKNAKIALLDASLEVKETEIDSKINISDPSQLQAFLDQEETYLKNLVDKIKSSGANVVFCQKGIDDTAQHYLAKYKILAIRRVNKSDMDLLSKATGAKINSKISELSPKDLGFAGLVEERKLGGENMILVGECKNPKAVSIIIRGGTEHVVDEIERAIKDAIGDLALTIKSGFCIAGGGSIEVELSKRLREFADSLSGRDQLAVKAFADTLEAIPLSLAENAGLDPIDMLTALKADHDKGNVFSGLNVFKGKVENMWNNGVIEPLNIKIQAIQSASEAAILLLRIDDVVSGGSNIPAMPHSGAGMPPMM